MKDQLFRFKIFSHHKPEMLEKEINEYIASNGIKVTQFRQSEHGTGEDYRITIVVLYTK